ncbi:cilia- and flagella-associated protein 91-like [Epargyreus clarus]|uniref:cilia- and flagella-associated protein 91-like n=1 Tax=Epargyreus clarus TaxID=520877 RepID=UPI003C2CBD75
MSGETIYEAPRTYNVSKMRVHDYLYDSAFIVSGARDYARTAFRAAMASAQVVLQPVYKTMFSELRKYPRMHVVYHPNCRLPPHVDRTYGAYLRRVEDTRAHPPPDLGGKHRFKYSAAPKKLLALKCSTPDFHPPTPLYQQDHTKPRNRGTQSVYRESSAQTIPWQPDAKPAENCETTPEVLYLDKLKWGPGKPYRWGDLPADFHTTEIINKMRHARTWMEVVEGAQFPRWMKKRDAIISDVETKDWIFREAEIDELQGIRLALLYKMQTEERQKQASRTGRKLAKLWDRKKREMDERVHRIRQTRDRELRKLTALHGSGGRAGLVQSMRASRGGGSVTLAAHDPTSNVHAAAARNGYQARRRHGEITYDPSLLLLEDHEQVAAPPAWLEQCGQNLKRTCSGHHKPLDTTQLCERETKWSEHFLESLHNDLKKARLGAASTTAGPLHVLKPRKLLETPRPTTPEVESVPDDEEMKHQAALNIQKIIRGRAVQNLMFEGRTRASELTEELKTTHGLQKEDQVRIAREEARARDYHAVKTEAEQKEDAITALVEELCGGAVSAALDFLEKELRRLKEERRQHAYILIALREKSMREAAEAGRRQKEERRRREHDEMFKQVLGVTQETVEAYLQEIITEGVELAAEEQAVARAKLEADRIDALPDVSTAEQHEVVAELVQQFLLPEAQAAGARRRLAALQAARLRAAAAPLLQLLREREPDTCTRCGRQLGDTCRCGTCPVDMRPVETDSRDDPRWRHTRSRPAEEKTLEERYPPEHEIRCMLNDLLEDVVVESRGRRGELQDVYREYGETLREQTELNLDVKDIINEAIAIATGEKQLPVMKADYRHYMRRVITDALERTEPFERTDRCPAELPSEIRRRADEAAAALADTTCKCEEEAETTGKVQFVVEPKDSKEKMKLLPSELRTLEEMRRCKCDSSPSYIDSGSPFYTDDMTEAGTTEGSTIVEEQEEK